MIKNILKHICVVKLFDEAFLFSSNTNNSKTLIFLFDCLDMKPNIPACFFKRLYLYIAGCLFQCLYIR